MYNIQWRDGHPIHLDICKLLGGPLLHILHSFHRGYHQGKDLHIGIGCKLCCLGIPSHGCIHLFLLEKTKFYFEYSSYLNSYFFQELQIRDLLGVHLVYGSPSVPGGHVQLGLWLETAHLAVELHGFSCLQGLMQALFLHAWLDGHSSSDEQPARTGAAKKQKNQHT